LGIARGTGSLGQVDRSSLGSKAWVETLIFIRKLTGLPRQGKSTGLEAFLSDVPSGCL